MPTSRRTAESIFPAVYEELRRLAKCRLINERPGQTLSATALVHEAFLLITKKGDEPLWDSDGHFFAAAAESIRRILREKALKKKRIRHGGNFRRLNLEECTIDCDLANSDWSTEFLDLDEALKDRQRERPAAADLVILRFFSGLALPQAAAATNISERTAHRYWAFAKAWLYQRLEA